MPPAARVTDMHVCPMVTGIVPHVGGPILPPGAPTVLIDFLPAANVTTMATCVGPPDVIVRGSSGVFVNFLPAARMGDQTAHGGVIVMGAPNVIIGEVGGGSAGAGGPGAMVAGLAASPFSSSMVAGAVASTAAGAPKSKLEQWRDARQEAIEKALADQKDLLEKRKASLEKWDDAAKADAKKWFGSDDEATRKTLLDRTNKELELNKSVTIKNFYPADPPDPGTYAYVYPNDADHKIYLDSGFDNAPATGTDSKAGTLAHEMSHFDDVGGTKDNVYGQQGAQALAKSNPEAALGNADSYEYYVESAK
jgi:uncharacterized Zn-binding protein involved in type VI secretion